MVKNAGINVELIAVFDRPDQDTIEVFKETPLKAFEQIKTTTIDVGSLGLARNAGIDLAEGEFVWTADGDDLVSRNSIVELVKTARSHPHPKVAVFVDYLAALWRAISRRALCGQSVADSSGFCLSTPLRFPHLYQ